MVGIYIAAHLGPVTKPELFMREDHPRIVVFATIRDKLPIKPEEKPNVNFMWGTNGMNTIDVNFWDRSYAGEVEFDSKFSENFHLPENQQHFLV